MNRCICGAAVLNLSHDSGRADDDPLNVWMHEPGSDTRCTEVRRIDDALPDRILIQGAAEQMANLVERNRRASGELERLASGVAELTEEFERLRDNVVLSPQTIRRSALFEAWHELIEAENLAGARTVRDMIKAVK